MEGSTIANPAYVDAPQKDFSIKAGTACTGRGAPASVAGLEPNTTIESGPAVSGRSATITFSSSKPGSAFECDLDGPSGTAVEPCTGPKTYTDLIPGQYTVYVRARVVGSRADPTPASATFTIPVVCHQVAVPNTAVDTAQELVALLQPGETGCFRGGHHNVASGADPRYLVITKPGITLRSYPGEVATLHGVWEIRHEAPRVTLESMVLDVEHAIQANGILVLGDNATLRNNDISNGTSTARASGICVHVRDQAAGVVPENFLIAGNRVHHCGIANNHQHGIYVLRGNGTIRDNAVFENADRRIQLWQDADNVKVLNNTVVANGSNIAVNDHRDSGACCSEGNLVEFNVATHATPRGLSSDHPWNLEAPTLSGGGNVMSNNCVYAVAPGHTYRGGIENGIETRLELRSYTIATASPLYQDRAAGDLRLRDAACLSSGVSENPRRGAPDHVLNPVGFLPR